MGYRGLRILGLTGSHKTLFRGFGGRIPHAPDATTHGLAVALQIGRIDVVASLQAVVSLRYNAVYRCTPHDTLQMGRAGR